ncbi:MAG: hypothetical protein JJT77_08915 [Crocinitomicaceae bacterium]|nr:hypothetical protein [Crocinitomicaceae bacterium]
MFLTVLVLSLSGCKKSEITSIDEINIKRTSSYEFNWEDVDYETIGVQHNEFMIKAYDIHKSTGRLGQAILGELNFDLDLPLQKAIYQDFHSKSIEEHTEYVLNNLGKDAKIVYSALRETLYSSDDYISLVRDFDSIKHTLTRFKGLDYGVLLSFIEVGKASAYLWFPTSEAGSGLGDEYLLNTEISQNRASNDPPRTTVEKDVLGASTSMVGWALTGGASFGPWGALGGFIAGTVFGAVSGSLIG